MADIAGSFDQFSVLPVSNSQTQPSAILKRVSGIINNEETINKMPTSSLEYLATLLKDNSSFTRRNVKSILESEALGVHSRYIEEYEKGVVVRLEAKVAEIDSIQDLASECIDKLSGNHDRLSSNVERCNESESKFRSLEEKVMILSKFSTQFHVDRDLATQVSECPLGVSVLDLFDKVDTKRKNCMRLIELMNHSQLALDCLDKSMPVLDLLFEKITASVTRNAITSHSDTARALAALADRPHYLDQCVSAITKARSNRLNERFVDILLHGEDGEGGLELNAFDAPRFLSDMLHWLLEQVTIEDEEYEIFDGVTEMISDRIDAMLNSTFNIVELYKLSSILAFYTEKIKKLWTKKEYLKVWNRFVQFWKKRMEDAKSSVHLRNSLQPFGFLNETVFLINSILTIRSTDELLPVLEIDDILALCESVSKKSNFNSAAESCVFLMNCYSTLELPLKQEFLETAKQIDSLIEMQMETLVKETCECILKKVGLFDKWQLVTSGKAGEIHSLSLSSNFKAFYTALFTQGIWTIGHVDSLQTRELRTRARWLVATKLAAVYDELYRDFSSIATHSPDQNQMEGNYAFSLTTFSPSGKLGQLEHALNAVTAGVPALGIKAKDGVVIATEKKFQNALVDTSSFKKVEDLTVNVGSVYAGMPPDYQVILKKGRKAAQKYLSTYGSQIPVRQLASEIAAVMQEFTQSGGVRPFGLSLMIAGVDEIDGPQLYQVDPSGAFFGWKASAIGKNFANAKTFLEKRYAEDIEVEDAIHTAILTLKEGFEGQITEHNIEIGVVRTSDGIFRSLTPAEIKDYLSEVE